MKSLLSALLVAVSFAAPAFAASDVVTIYAADGLHDGKGSWFETQFDAFTKATGIKVQYVEAGSGGVVERVAKEKSNPQADVLVTLPPFIQRAEADGPAATLQARRRDQIADRRRRRLLSAAGQQLPELHLQFRGAQGPAEDLRRSARSEVQGQDPVFDARPGRRRHRGHDPGDPRLRQQGRRLRLLKKLQDNNVGPSASTGKLTALVNKGELYVANGDLQMNMSQMADNPNIQVFWPAGPDGKRSTFALPYYVGLVARRARRRQRQEADRLPALQGGAGDASARSRSACRCART